MKHLSRLLCLAVLLVPAHRAADLPADVDALLADRLLKRAAVGVEIVRLGDKPAGDATLYPQGRPDAADPRQQPQAAHDRRRRCTSSGRASSSARRCSSASRRPRDRRRRRPDLRRRRVAEGPRLGRHHRLRKLGRSTRQARHHERPRRHRRRQRSSTKSSSIPTGRPTRSTSATQAEVGGFNLNANVLEFAVRPTSVGQVATYTTNPPDTQLRRPCATPASRATQNAIWLSRQAGTNQIILRGETPGRAQVPVAVTIHDPPMYAATVFAEVLRRKGIAVTGTVRRDRTLRRPAAASPAATAGACWRFTKRR